MDIKSQLESLEKQNLQATADIARRDEEINELLAEHPDAMGLHQEVMDELTSLDGDPAGKQAPSDDEGVIPMPTTGSGGVVWGNRQWLANAAFVLLGVGIALSYSLTQTQELTSSTAQVYYLDVTRSLQPRVEPITVDPSQPLTTLVVYPSFSGYVRLSAVIQRYQGAADAFAAAPEQDWNTVAGFNSGLGNQDSLALNVLSEQLSPGLYRVQVFGEQGAEPAVLDLQLYFNVTR